MARKGCYDCGNRDEGGAEIKFYGINGISLRLSMMRDNNGELYSVSLLLQS